jgi:hypothetical protein
LRYPNAVWPHAKPPDPPGGRQGRHHLKVIGDNSGEAGRGTSQPASRWPRLGARSAAKAPSIAMVNGRAK